MVELIYWLIGVVLALPIAVMICAPRRRFRHRVRVEVAFSRADRAQRSRLNPDEVTRRRRQARVEQWRDQV